MYTIEHKDDPDTRLSLLEAVSILKLLYAKYGKKLQLQEFKLILNQHSPFLIEIIELLDQHKAFNFRSLEKLAWLLQKTQKKDKTFVYKSHGKGGLDRVFDLLEKKFGSVDVEYQQLENDDLSFSVKGQGYQYSRSLSGDVDKLLA